MSDAHFLPLDTALTKLNTNKQDLRARANLSAPQLRAIEERGATLAEADQIAHAYGQHPSEIWGENWVDAVLTFQEEDND